MGFGEMPREKIHSAVPEFDVSVAWNKDGTVQIVTAATDADERLRAWTELKQGRVYMAGDPDAQTAPGTAFTLFDGWHVDLDRRQVNELIRVLRRARDQAFGRDE